MNLKTILICIALYMIFKITSECFNFNQDQSFFMGWIGGTLAVGISHGIKKTNKIK